MKKTRVDQTQKLTKQLEAAQRSAAFWDAHNVEPLAERYRRRAEKLQKLIAALNVSNSAD